MISTLARIRRPRESQIHLKPQLPTTTTLPTPHPSPSCRPRLHPSTATSKMQGLAISSGTAAVLSRQLLRRQPIPTASAVARIVAQRTYATPSGPPPKGFRLPRKPNWDEEKESTLDRAGKYFLLLEMFRGMYVALEQFFRPP